MRSQDDANDSRQLWLAAKSKPSDLDRFFLLKTGRLHLFSRSHGTTTEPTGGRSSSATALFGEQLFLIHTDCRFDQQTSTSASAWSQAEAEAACRILYGAVRLRGAGAWRLEL